MRVCVSYVRTSTHTAETSHGRKPTAYISSEGRAESDVTHFSSVKSSFSTSAAPVRSKLVRAVHLFLFDPPSVGATKQPDIMFSVSAALLKRS